MGKFKVICAECNSDKIMEMTSRKQIDWSAGRVKYALGIQRKCTECKNEDFTITETSEI